MTFGEALLNATKTLSICQPDSARLDAELILSDLLGLRREGLLISSKKELGQEDFARFNALIARRALGEPVAYLIGKKAFFGIDFFVQPGVLIPRPETEHLVEEALQWIASKDLGEVTIWDLGCGSGCLGLSILNNSPNSRLIAVDKSSVACDVTRKNAQKLNLEARVEVFNTDVQDLAHHPCDIVVANPPYVSLTDTHIDANVKKYEPAEALFSGETGLECITQWKNVATRLLRPGGIILMEFGFAQRPRTKEIFESDPAYENVRIGKDLSGHDRYISATRQATED